MTREEPLLRNIPPLLQRYGLAILSVAIALGFGLFLANYKVEGVEFPLFLFAIAVTVWYAGTWPAILALLLATAPLIISSRNLVSASISPGLTFHITQSSFSLGY